MAEYIDREEFGKQILFECNRIRNKQMSTGLSDAYGMLWDFPKADVVERSKIDKSIEEINDMAYIGFYAESLGNKVLVFKDDVLEILKRNVGE